MSDMPGQADDALHEPGLVDRVRAEMAEMAVSHRSPADVTTFAA